MSGAGFPESPRASLLVPLKDLLNAALRGWRGCHDPGKIAELDGLRTYDADKQDHAVQGDNTRQYELSPQGLKMRT